MQNLKIKAIGLLHWTEKYLKTDMLYIVKSGFWLSVSQWITSLSALILAVAFANFLPKETYGFYKYILSIVSILSIPTLTGIDLAVTQAVSRGFDGSFNEGFKTKLKFGLLSSLACILTALYYLYNNNLDFFFAFMIAALFLPLLKSFDLYNSLLQGKKEFRMFAWCNGLTQVGTALALILSVLSNKSLIPIVLIYFLTNFLMNFFCFRITQKKLNLNKLVDPETIKYGKHLTLIGVISMIVAELDKILVFHYLGATELAIYAFANAPADQMKGLFKNIPFLAFPKFANQDARETRAGLTRKALMLGVGVAIVVLIYIGLAPLFFKLLFPKYLESVVYSKVLSLSLIFIMPATLLSTFMESQRETGKIYRYNIFYNVTSIVTLFIFIYFWGVWGAITARVLTRGLSLINALYLVKD